MKIGRLFINGEWVETAKKMDIISPVDRELIGQIYLASVSDVQAAVNSAKSSFDKWRKLGYRERGIYLARLREFILRDKDIILGLINRETGRPLIEILMQEIISPLMKIDFLIKNAENILKEEKIRYFRFCPAREKGFISFEPLGVIGIILPKTVPFSMPLDLVAAALMAGNTVVLKPSEFLSICWIKMAELFQEAGFPKGVLNIILGGKEAGEYIIDTGVDKIFFIGTSDAGKAVMKRAAERLTPLCLELGGNASFILLEDIDLEISADAAIWGAFNNSGQNCASIKHIFVVEKIAEDFIGLIKQKTDKLRVGDGKMPDIDVGPLIERQSIERLQYYIKDAVSKGASIICGGTEELNKKGFFFSPVVLANVDCSMKIAQEEALGPIISILKVKDAGEALTMVNNLGYGLSASIWTKDIENAKCMAKMLNVGTVWINNTLFIPPAVPWGGVRKSGFGRVGSKYGLLELVNIKHINVSCAKRKKIFYPYNQHLLNFYNTILPLFAKGTVRKILGFLKLLVSKI